MPQTKNYVYVVNPISGDLDKSKVSAAVAEFAEKQNIQIITFETTGNNDAQKLQQLYDKYQPERIIIAGGDGTVKFVAEALEKEDVILGIIPCGSANGLSVDLNLPNTLEEQIAVAFQNISRALDMICINNKRSLHLSDIGLNAELIKNYEDSSIRGKLGYALQAVNTLTDKEVTFEAVVSANGQAYKSTAKMIVVANSQKYGTGVTINPSGKIDDGKFEIIIFKDINLGIFSKVVMGDMPDDPEKIQIISTDKAIITTDIPVDFQIDGEYCGQEARLDIHILHKQMKVAVPLINGLRE